MKKIAELKKTLREHKEELQKNYKVKQIGLFGSYLRDKQKKGSDLDVLVEFIQPISLFKFIDLEPYLQRLLSVKVDLVSQKTLKPYLGQYILKEVSYI